LNVWEEILAFFSLDFEYFFDTPFEFRTTSHPGYQPINSAAEENVLYHHDIMHRDKVFGGPVTVTWIDGYRSKGKESRADLIFILHQQKRWL
jgi:hypothetical protein